ncbi:MAG: cupin domain-containing protein [Pseudomonadota bacterium]|nr:cupin domain-containing protein [Pseudomonadota bacterium]
MKLIIASMLALSLSAAASAQEMVINRAAEQASMKPPAQNFTGNVRVAPLFAERAPLPSSAAAVTFEPGARSAWHTHPAGQYLIVTHGAGRVRQWGGKVQEIRAGDVVWTPPGMKHWHGAAPTTGITHIALQDKVGGRNVDWMEKVSDEQYGK